MHSCLILRPSSRTPTDCLLGYREHLPLLRLPGPSLPNRGEVARTKILFRSRLSGSVLMISATHDEAGSPDEPARESAFDFLERDHNRRMRRNWIILFILPPLLAIIFSVIWLSLPRLYQARGEIRITHGVGSLHGGGTSFLITEFGDEIALLFTSGFKRRVAMELPLEQRQLLADQLDVPRTGSNNGPDPDALLDNGVRILGDLDPALLLITADNHDPRLAAAIVNATIHTAISEQYLAAIARSQILHGFFVPKLNALEDLIHEEEKQEDALGMSPGLTDFTDRRGAFTFQNAPAETAFTALNGVAAQAALDARLRTAEVDLVQSLQQHNPGAVDQLADDAVLATLQQSLVEARTSYQVMADTLGSNNPQMQASVAEITGLKTQIAALRQLHGSGLRNRAELAKKTADAVHAQVAADRKGVSAMRDLRKSSAVLEIELAINLRLLADMQKKVSEYSINAALTSLQVEVVHYADVPTASPGVALLQSSGVGFLSGVVLALCINATLQLLNRKRWNIFGMEDAAGQPVFALFQQAPAAGPEVHVPQGFGDPLRELRSSLGLLRGGHSGMTAVLTSSRGAEGTSTVAAALARLLGQSGERVLLLDANLYRPALHRLFSLPGSVGLSQLLTGGATLGQAIQSVALDGPGRLDVVTAGPPPPSPSELLQSFAFDALLRQARQDYTHVLLDSAPAGAPVGILSMAQVDTVLLIARFETVDLRQVRYTEQLLFNVQAPLKGVLINGVPQGARGAP